MKFKNISDKVKNFKLKSLWKSVEPGEEIELPIDVKEVGLKKIEDKKVKAKKEDKENVVTNEGGETFEEVRAKKKEEKEVVDVSELDEKSKERVEDLKEDLKDDGKRNNSHKKSKSKSKPKKKK